MGFISVDVSREIYEKFFYYGVLVVPNERKRSDIIPNAENWQVKDICKKLLSRNCVAIKKSARSNYYILNNEGIDHLRKMLNKSQDDVPLTQSKTSANAVHLGKMQSLAKEEAAEGAASQVKEANIAPAESEIAFRGGFRTPAAAS